MDNIYYDNQKFVDCDSDRANDKRPNKNEKHRL